MSFKIAYCAGHYINTPGKRLPKEIDKNQTREWVLNDRVADFFAEAAALYEDVELLRTDDPTGKKEISIKNRTKKANEWGADLYIDMHHNAAGKVFSGGGVVVFCKKKSATGNEYRDVIYAEIIAAGGLKGNRSNPLVEKNYSTMLNSKATAILIEYGFMDSTVDAPVILTEAYSKLVAYATMEGVAKVAGLKKKVISESAPVVSKPKPEENSTTKSGVCNVEVKVLRKGDKNDQVKALQHLLIGYGFKMTNNGKTYGVDGSFGGATQNAVIAFQRAKNLEDDGVCGPKTWAKLLGV